MTIQGMPNLTASDGTVAQFGLGDIYEKGGASWQYVQASAAVDAFSLVRIVNGAFTIAETTVADLTTTRPNNVGVVQYGFATGEYGWVAIGPFILREDGVTTFKVLSKVAAAGVVLYGTATAGSVDDAVAAPIIQGLTLTTACAADDTAAPCIATRRLSTTS